MNFEKEIYLYIYIHVTPLSMCIVVWNILLITPWLVTN